MPTLRAVIEALETIAPLRLAADWDSVGLLVGTHRPQIDRLMTCLSLTPEVAAEAVREQAEMVVTHHPLPFRPVPRITTDTATGRVLLELIQAGIAVWSSHTAWDSAAGGINDQLAALMGLDHVTPIEPDPLHALGRLWPGGHGSVRLVGGPTVPAHRGSAGGEGGARRGRHRS